jgi:regulator of sirC expression with transglutaminase-like and TPR domain
MQSARLFTHPALARRRFRELASRPDPSIDLTEASLVIALEEYPAIDLDHYLGQLDRWSEEIRQRIQGSTDVERVLEAMNHLLFEEEGFHGQSEGDYYDPRTAFLNEVFDRHTGVPLTLSILYIELSRRVGLPMTGVALPGRFLVKISGPFGELLVDPFDEGRVLTTVECQRIMDQVFGGAVRLREHHLRGSSNREILARLLAHLKSVYLTRDDLQGAVAAIDRLLILDPRDSFELRDRGLLAMQMHAYEEAIEYLESYLESEGAGDDRRQIRDQIHYLRAWLQQN